MSRPLFLITLFFSGVLCASEFANRSDWNKQDQQAEHFFERAANTFSLCGCCLFRLGCSPRGCAAGLTCCFVTCGCIDLKVDLNEDKRELPDWMVR